MNTVHLSVFFGNLNRYHGEDCWLDSCQEDSLRHLPYGGWDTEGLAVSKHIHRMLSRTERVAENVHKQQWWLQLWEDCQVKPIQDSQEVDWGWSQCIKSHSAQMLSVNGLQLSHAWYPANPEDDVWNVLHLNWTVAQWFVSIKHIKKKKTFTFWKLDFSVL